MAYYHITKENLLTADLSTPDLGDSNIIGEVRSQGVEIDITGQVTDHLSLIGSYAYTDASQTKDNNGNQGNRLANVPEHSGSLWAKYDFTGYAVLDGFSVGLGGIAVGQREGDLANSFQLPGFVRVDTYAAYAVNVGKTKVTVQFNIHNLLDKEYFESTDPDSNVSPRNSVYLGEPITVVGSLRVEF